MGGQFAIVHNGIIENYYSLKKGLIAADIEFASETDTEVIVQLLAYYYSGDMLSTLIRVLPMLEGSFALGIIDANRPDVLYCTRKDSPLVVGKGQDCHVIASDIPAILEHSRDIYMLDNLNIGVISRDDALFYDEFGNEMSIDATHIDWDVSSAEKGGFAHFMLKEIYDEPKVLYDTISHYIERENAFSREKMPWDAEFANGISRITVLGCGTAYHAGCVGVKLFEELAHIPAQAHLASEYRYSDVVTLPGEVVVVVSQSGETADTIAAMRKARSNGCKVVALCNVIGSTIAREADIILYTLAGPEIAVASTKAFLSQVLMLELLALDLSNLRGYLSSEELSATLCELKKLPDEMTHMLEDISDIQHFASIAFDCKSVFFIGRGLDYVISMEAALKLKEISYIHSESYAAGELKHGTIALIEKGTIVVAMATQTKVLEKMLSNIEEVRVRGAHVLALAQDSCEKLPELKKMGDVWTLPSCMDIFLPLLSIVPMQLFAYFMALQKGCDIDKPRNLAKSVTVE